MIQKESKPFIPSYPKSIGQWFLSLAIAMALLTGAIYFYYFLRARTTAQNPAPTNQQSTPKITAVAALGRLEPQGEITRLSAPASLEGIRVKQILVKEGERVSEGQVVAILDNHGSRLAALEKAQSDVQVARARLEKVKAGAKQGDINAQKEQISRLEAELNGQIITQKAAIAGLKAELDNAKAENRRYQQLYQEGAIAASEADNKRLRVETTREQLNEARAALERTVKTLEIERSEAKATLDSIAEVRPVDVQFARAELETAIAAARQAEEELKLTYIKAPKAGQILKVHARAGEVIGSQGIAQIAQTDRMYVVAQVYETDIGKVRLGQQATITSEAFPSKLRGEVDHIGLQVNQQDIFDNDPLANTDNKVVEVKIRLDSASSEQVAGLSNLQVQTVIHL